MSCFRGIFNSLPGVSCDRFDGENLNSDQFFLTHCHSDHMHGLDQLCLELRRRNAVIANHKIYCSRISQAFLLRKYPCLHERYVKALDPSIPIDIDVFDRANEDLYKVRVTTIGAQHCPGSVMFLFEKIDPSSKSIAKRILYTGDFRFEEVPLSSLRPLHIENLPMPIDELYLDTTFCSPRYPFFPTRNAAKAKIWEIVHGWVRKNGIFRNQRAKHVVLLQLPASYGSEPILNHIYEKSSFKWKIHVSDKKFQDYLCATELFDCTDSDSRKAQWVHACSWITGQKDSTSRSTRFNQMLPCQKEPFEVCHIKPSALFFDKDMLKKAEDNLVKITGENYYRVCYSSHSSLNELMDFVKYFQPKKIFPCVIPPKSSQKEVLELFLPVLENPESVDLMTTQELLGDISSLSSNGSKSSSQDKDFIQSLYSPNSPLPSPSTPTTSNNRKRKFAYSTEVDLYSGDGKRPLTTSSPKPLGASSDNDEEDHFGDMGGAKARSKRNLFKSSKANKANYSMPVRCTSPPTFQLSSQQNRRASLPHNLKIPIITITRSSPSPDPNHPDYPEFFETENYMETKRMSTSTESSAGAATKEMDIDKESFKPSATSENDDSSLEIVYDQRDEAMEDLNTTGELEDIIMTAQTSEEKANIINFMEAQSKKKTS